MRLPALARRARSTAVAALVLAVGSAPGVPAIRVAAAQGHVQARAASTDVTSYTIDARWDPASKQIAATARITFRNTSSDSLPDIWLWLYLNAFRSADTDWMRAASAAHRGQGFDPAHPGWIRVDRLAIADTGELLELPGGGDTDQTEVRAVLPRPLPAGGALMLDVAWTAQLPRVFARTGFFDDFVMAGQWYPRLAVYDRGAWQVRPWHPNAEFFHDAGAYDLTLHLPAGYVTGATGVRVAESAATDGMQTVRYRADSVSDVAWTAWPDFQVRTAQVETDRGHIDVEALLPPGEVDASARHFAAARAALTSFSRWYGPYPWPKLTIVVPPPGAGGAAGMEYPALVTTGGQTALPFGLGRGVRDLEVVTVHEIAHQWFPMQVQSFEPDEPWLDEGFADYLTIRVLDRLYGAERSFLDLPLGRLGYGTVHRAAFLAGALRQPIGQPAHAFSNPATYAATVYSKGALALLTLEGLLGDDRFTGALGAYADRWRWRHPTGADLQAVLEEQTGESLGPFFQSYVSGSDVADVRVRRFSNDWISIDRAQAGAILPVPVQATSAQGRLVEQTFSGLAVDFRRDASDPFVSIVIDPDRRLALQANRLDDGRTVRLDLWSAAAVATRWHQAVQWLLQAVGQFG